MKPISEFINKVIQGDSLEILKEIPNESVDLVITDPPYAISQRGKEISRKSLSSKSWKRDTSIKLDFGKWDNFETEEDFFEFTESWFKECVRVLKPKGWIYIFFDKQKIGYFDLLLAPKYNIKSRTIFAWLKTNPTPSFRKVNWLSASEFIWVGSKGKSKLKNFLAQKEMFNYMLTPNKSAYGKTEHPTEKPLSLIEKFILTSSNEDDIVLDPFLGSGTTAVACKKLGRKFIGIEKEQKYVDIANKRLNSIPKRLFSFSEVSSNDKNCETKS
jgi:DNA modification methylase